MDNQTFQYDFILKGDAGALSILHRDIFLKESWSQQSFEELLSLPSTFGLKAEKEGRILGFILLSKVLDEGEILTFCIASAHQKKGIGTGLLKGALNFLKAQQCVSVFLEVNIKNKNAIRFYERHHFQKTGLRKGYYEKKGDAIVMQHLFNL